MTGREALMRVRRLFTAGQWTRGAMHKQINGKDLYCLVGGLRHVTGAHSERPPAARDYKAYREAMSLLQTAISSTDPITFNDRHYEPGPVIEAIDRAIALDQPKV